MHWQAVLHTGDLPMSIFTALSPTVDSEYDWSIWFVWAIRVTSKSALAEIKVSTSDQMQQGRVPRSSVKNFSTVLAAYIVWSVYI